MNTQTTRRILTPEFKAKVVIEALREQSTLVDIANMGKGLRRNTHEHGRKAQVPG
ncbi:hypothetical protein [Prevotella sp. P5-92]|uniref:hypothetical protein n=1 Tax=Prevotella sp. P5-92 TaxID=2024222 RepID=UPI001303ADC5|nr:hypothetical protein [Prevotella sp. P5-92]